MTTTNSKSKKISPDQKFIIEVTAEDLQMIGEVLSELPYKTSSKLINKLNDSVNESLKEKPLKKKKEGVK